MSDAGDRILASALRAKSRVLDVDTKFMDSRSDVMIPSDFGEHLEIPEEAITVETMDAKPRKLKAYPVPDLTMVRISDLEKHPELKSIVLLSDAEDFYIEKRQGAESSASPLYFTDDMEYFREKLFKAVRVTESYSGLQGNIDDLERDSK